MTSNWLRWFCSLELVTILIIVVSQTVVALLQAVDLRAPNLLICSACLIASACANQTLPLVTDKRICIIILSFELMMMTIAGASGIISGFQLLLLILVAKAGVLCGRNSGRLFGFFTLIAYIVCVQTNPEMVMQGSVLTEYKFDFVQTILSKDLISFLISLGVVLVTVDAIASEAEHRKYLEALAEKLDELSADIERNRISESISASANSSLQAVHTSLVRAWQSKANFESVECELKEAKEQAGESLQQIRAALVMMREEPDLQ